MSFFEKYKACIDEKISSTKRSIVVIKENNRRYELVNKGSWVITKFFVEGCITKKEGEKGCEAVLIAMKDKNKSKGFFVELKGMSVRAALKQVKSAFEKTKNDLKDHQLYGRIVPSEYKRTKFLDAEQGALIKLFKSYGGDLNNKRK